nr:M3 family oligoendopeptidase [Clostridia bacterium]
MKFKDMPYVRPDLTAVEQEMTTLTEALQTASSYEEARGVFLKMEALRRHLETAFTLSSIRHSIDTRDAFYEQEKQFADSALPELAAYVQNWTEAMLSSRFRAEFEAEYGALMFVNAEIERRTFKPEMIPLLQKENELSSAYDKLIASAQIPFRGGVYTISQMAPFKSDADDILRLEAWQAEGQWYKDHQPELDRIYDELVHLRDEMGKMLGYENYIPLGYDRMSRNCYDQNDVKKFREAVVEY